VPNQIDFISLSFTPDAAAVEECRDIVRGCGAPGIQVGRCSLNPSNPC
jgi:pyruvate kinase